MQVSTDLVALYKALGGGWQADAAVVPGARDNGTAGTAAVAAPAKAPGS
jgi:hypothetical protein